MKLLISKNNLFVDLISLDTPTDQKLSNASKVISERLGIEIPDTFGNYSELISHLLFTHAISLRLVQSEGIQGDSGNLLLSIGTPENEGFGVRVTDLILVDSEKYYSTLVTYVKSKNIDSPELVRLFNLMELDEASAKIGSSSLVTYLDLVGYSINFLIVE